MRWAVLIACTAAAATACGTSGPARRPDDVPEPAVSPPVAAMPTGRLITLPPGSAPEGLVADAATGTLAIGARRPGRQGELLDPLPLFPGGEPDPSRQGSGAGMGEADVEPVNTSPVAGHGASPPLPSFGGRRIPCHATTLSKACDDMASTALPTACLDCGSGRLP